MNNYFSEIFHLVFPERCAVCSEELPEGANFICPKCAWNMPLTGFYAEHDNPVFRKFGGLVPIKEASSLIFFSHHSPYRNLIHRFKYYGQWNLSIELGKLIGRKLKVSDLYKSIDIIIPIPLHLLRYLKRGYNQAEYLARGIASEINLPVDTSSVKRSGYNRSQTKTQNHHDRWHNVAGIFTVKNPSKIDGKHILLIDDVLTTGATIISCAQSILKACPSCRISIVTLAVSSYELFGKHSGGL